MLYKRSDLNKNSYSFNHRIFKTVDPTTTFLGYDAETSLQLHTSKHENNNKKYFNICLYLYTIKNHNISEKSKSKCS